jgi:hypothetical protein
VPGEYQEPPEVVEIVGEMTEKTVEREKRELRKEIELPGERL